MDNDRLYVGQSGSRYFADERATETEGQIRVPVAEERLEVEKRQAELGAVEIHKTVESEQVSAPVELMREEVRVEEVDVKDRPLATADASTAFQETTIRVPVRGEEAVVRKEAVVTGEVVIDKERQTERQTVSDTVRRERVEIDRAFDEARSGFRQHFDQRRSSMGTQVDTRRYEDAEPNYRTGFTAAYDQRYAGRDFDEVEPNLRRDWESSGTRGSGDSWEHLREEIREGWNRARGR
jgi:uncharacterized protein (TIGR02271 family)